MHNADLSIVIVNFNTKDLLLSCIGSIQKNTKDLNYEIIVVDNASYDGSVEEIRKLKNKNKNIRLIENNINLGFAKGNNIGIKNSVGKFILFLNTDTEIVDDVLKHCVNFMLKDDQIGAVTCALKNKDGTVQATGGYFPTLIRVFSWMTIQDLPFVDNFIKPFHPLHSKSGFSRGENFYATMRELDWVTGAFLMTRKSILNEIRGWDESYFMYVEEVDLCYQIKNLGYSVWYDPRKSIIHLGGASSKTNEFSLINEYSGIKKFYKKNYPKWQFNIMRLFLKIGALGRIVLFGVLEGSKTAQIYAKAFKTV